jgi:transcriptional regulator of arginine metabolism
MTTPKQDRQATILEVVQAHAVDSQEELRRLLRQRGWDVTQATLSRDLRELRLARVPSPTGPRYTISGTVPGQDGGPGALAGLLAQLLVGVDGVGELLVVRTVIGGAQPVAAALDREAWPEVIGTLGGDDTILLVCRSSAARERIARRLHELARK